MGDDIRIEVESLDKFFGLNMELNPKSERKFDEVIGNFVAEGYSFVLPVNIKIIERDLIFNDVGETKVKLRIDLKKETPQRSVHKIEIHELRNLIAFLPQNLYVVEAINVVSRYKYAFVSIHRFTRDHFKMNFIRFFSTNCNLALVSYLANCFTKIGIFFTFIK